MSDHATAARPDRVTMPSPGCLVAIIASILAMLLTASVLMAMHHRQESANDRNEKAALRRTVTQARSYAHDVLAKAPDDYPGREVVHGIAERHDGRLISYSYARSGGSLTITVRFFAEYEDTSMFGVSYSRAHRCYSFDFRRDAEGGLRERTTLLEKCDVA